MALSRRHWLAAAGGLPVLSAAAKRPNLVFILSDDHHFQALGAAGNPHIRTPNLDQLASRGMQFTNAVISTPQCGPSRGVLLSGLESYQNGLRSNGLDLRFRAGLGPTVPAQLRDAGYDTALVGKWHIENTPSECGFARMPLWLPGGASQYLNPVLRRGDAPPAKEPGHITELLTEAAIDVIQKARRPYLLWLTYNAPHTPWQADERWRAPYSGKENAALAPPAHPKSARPFDWATYYSVISHLDDAIGRVIRAVDETKQWDNTLIVFLGDNGYLCGTKGLDGKVFPWEESVRVPMIAAGGMVRRGVKAASPVSSVDVPATWLDLAGIKPRSPLAGRSLAKVLATGTGGPAEAWSAWDDSRADALVIKRPVEAYRLIHTGRYKLIVWESGKQALYEPTADPGEDNDLSASPAHAATLKDLRARLRARMQSTSDRAISWLK